MNFSVLDFFKVVASRMPQTAQILVSTFKIFLSFTNYVFDVFLLLLKVLAHTSTRKAVRKIAKLKLGKCRVGCLHPF